jgi:hypothetical protein
MQKSPEVLHLRFVRSLCASKMKAHLMENRPLLLPNNVPLSTPAAHEARHLSARQNSIALEELAQREVARTSDPIVQQNARIRAGLRYCSCQSCLHSGCTKWIYRALAREAWSCSSEEYWAKCYICWPASRS